ncbi:MAG: RsmF rRNA methyltransferase first C-terminal domain-containing protein [Clostridia bacterium]|nr:RsmF rRNA methyltransferase first C-terminal domain-containing protein [Clostridia bacterium]
MKLPVIFLDKMKSLLSDEEYTEFMKSYEMPRYYGLRVNTLKTGVEEFLKAAPFELEKIPWTEDGFYYREGASPGKHPYYYAGLYYIQEPSAMLPGSAIHALPGEKILDLCAAPGGKTVQIAAGMKGEGILVANDISADRVKALVKNIELCGVKNAIVTNETPDKLAGKFKGYFDKILVDAPCSGEGMFRKDEDAVRSYEKYKCEKCCTMQWDILEKVDEMLKPGGYLVYSTCTFSPEEDEVMITRFLEAHSCYEVVEIPKVAGIEGGRPEWSGGNHEIGKTVRLWPHKVKGEGHYAAMLKKKGKENLHTLKNNTPSNLEKMPAEFREFLYENLNIIPSGGYEMKGNNIYILPEAFPDLSGIKVAKFGWYLGSLEKGRFQPSHSMVIALKKEELKNVISLPSDQKEVIRYLKGETLMLEGPKGFVAVCVDDYTLGWAKGTGDMLKNLYPKGWRKMS